jgi:hypothetical protein
VVPIALRDDRMREGVDRVVRGGNACDESLLARRLGAFEVVIIPARASLATTLSRKRLTIPTGAV